MTTRLKPHRGIHKAKCGKYKTEQNQNELKIKHYSSKRDHGLTASKLKENDDHIQSE